MTVLLLVVSLLPLVTVFNQEGEAPWHLWVPALAQSVLMGRVLKGDALPAPDLLLPLMMCVALVAASLAYVARMLRQAAIK